MRLAEHAVVIVGGGPTGLMLAGELALTGVDVAIVERRTSQDVEGSRASGLHPRALELLDQRGIAERFINHGTKHYAVVFAGVTLDAADRSTRHNYTLAIRQELIERILADWIDELGVPVYRDCEVTDVKEDADGVHAKLADGRSVHAAYLVGCDGGRSLVRRKAGIDFPGWEPQISYLIFEADMANTPVWGIRHGDKGIHALGPLEPGKRVRGVVTEQQLERGGQPSFDQLRTALAAAYGTDFGVNNVTWLSRFTDAARQAASYRKGRVLLAGDAAHVHSPAGGQGLQIGLQDAVNLGWKLAQVIKGISPDSLLDTYHAERHPIGAAMLKQTLALTALNRGDVRTTALRELMATAMQEDEPRRWYAAMMSSLDIRYNLGNGHPFLGRRVPDLDLVTADGCCRVFSLLHDARPALLNLSCRESIHLAQWSDRVKLVNAQCDGAWELPVIGEVPAPVAVLIRPDGYAAWVGDGTTGGLRPALATWFGPPAEADP